MSRILVLGGGIAGLAAGYRLSQSGHEITLLEASDQLGGLGSTFEWRGQHYEKFYHTTTAADTALMQLVEDAGLKNQFDLRPTYMGMTINGAHYPFNTARDLLRFSAIPLHDRLRLGAGGLSLRALGRGKQLDDVTAEQWMRPIFGRRVWETLWQPMFGMKFGGHMPPALYLYERLARERNVSLRAYPKVGYRGLADGLGAAIERNGGHVVTNAPVRRLDSDGQKVVATTADGEIDARYALSTLPLPILKQLADGILVDAVATLPDIEYMGVINLLALTTQRATGHYWSFVTGSETEYEAQFELSELTGVGHFQGHWATYLAKYTNRASKLFRATDEVIRDRWMPRFLALHPHLSDDDVAATFVFRTPFVEPVWPLGYARRKPPPRLGTTPLFLATTAQSYPMVTSWNSATIVAERAVEAIDQVA